MLKNIPSIYFLILFFSFFGCEEFYNFEANKLNKKAEELIERSEIENNLDEKIKILSDALKEIEKIQNKYPKTKIARSYKKEKKINNLSSQIDKLKILSNKP